jgi:hypothetical protein
MRRHWPAPLVNPDEPAPESISRLFSRLIDTQAIAAVTRGANGLLEPHLF